MLKTYRGLLRNDRIEWNGEAPELPPGGQAVPVDVTLLPLDSAVSSGSDGLRMAAALECVAAVGALHITQPAEWERELRQDRCLPGREP